MAEENKRTFAAQEFKRFNLGYKFLYGITFNTIFILDLLAAGTDKLTAKLGKPTNLRIKFDDFVEKNYRGESDASFKEVVTIVPPMLTSLGTIVVSVSSLFSLYSDHQASIGNQKLGTGPIDKTVAYVTGNRPYATDMAAVNSFCKNYIQEKIAKCEKVATETKVERVREIIQTLSVLDTSKIIQDANGLNQETWKVQIIEKIDGVISQELQRLGLSDTTIKEAVLPELAEKTSASVDETRSEAIHSFRLKLLAERKAQVTTQAGLV